MCECVCLCVRVFVCVHIKVQCGKARGILLGRQPSALTWAQAVNTLNSGICMCACAPVCVCDRGREIGSEKLTIKHRKGEKEGKGRN